VKIGAGIEKMNHVGYLSEDGRRNVIPNSAIQNSGAGWSGSFSAFVTTSIIEGFKAFRDIDNFPAVLLLRNAEYAERTVAVLTADGPHRFGVVHYVGFAALPPSAFAVWRLQRDTDSFYWNDTTGGWQAGEIFNQLPPQYGVFVHRHSNHPIDCDQDENWTIRIKEGTENDDAVLIAQIDIQNTRYRLTPIVTPESGGLDEQEDLLKYVVEDDAARQLVYARRHSVRVLYTPLQDEADLADDDQLALFYAQWGASPSECIVAYYTRPTGLAARFVVDAVQGGSVVASAYKEHDIVREVPVEIHCRLVDETGEELKLRSRTLSLQVDGEKGVDAGLPAGFSISETRTELWLGYADSSFGTQRANGFIADLDAQQLALPDESALAAR